MNRTELSVKGTVVCENGSMSLVYIAEDGTEILVYDGEGGEIDIAVEVSKGKGKLYFVGDNAVYTFSMEISYHWILCYM